MDTHGPGELYRIDVHQGKAGKVTRLRTSRPLEHTDALRSIGRDRFVLVEGSGKLDRIIEGARPARFRCQWRW